MSLPDDLKSQVMQRALAGVVSLALHVGMFMLIALSGGQHEGVGESANASAELVLIPAPDADQREGLDLTPLEPTLSTAELTERLSAQVQPPAALSAPEIANTPTDQQELQAPSEMPAAANTQTGLQPAPSFVMSPVESSRLERRLAHLAEELVNQPQTQVRWEQDGTQYSAVLIQQRANDGMALERVVAEVSATGRGGQLTTRVILKRLAFSNFTQMVDRWDPLVQLHDDVIIGRFHSNSQFNVLEDSGAAPEFRGKVTTAARSIGMQARTIKRQSQIFRGGVETRAGQIRLPDALQPSRWAAPEANARVHELAEDTRIKFFADGSYSWLTGAAPSPEYLNAPSQHPVYFIAARGATLYVKGVVAGKILVYSPHRIVIEGSLKYAQDPRAVPNSPDYLGLVCDKYIEVAPPEVTGPGDLQIHAAILAGRRFVVRDVWHRRSATLRILGSLAAGSLSASEPRYATQIEYDERFERQRPPGFPSTNRYEVEEWDSRWAERPEHSIDDSL